MRETALPPTRSAGRQATTTGPPPAWPTRATTRNRKKNPSLRQPIANSPIANHPMEGVVMSPVPLPVQPTRRFAGEALRKILGAALALVALAATPARGQLNGENLKSPQSLPVRQPSDTLSSDD